MQLSGAHHFQAPPQRVWAALHDVQVLQQILPGSTQLERVSETEFSGTVAVEVGPLQARMRGRATLSDLDPPHAYTLRGEGNGGSAGIASGQVRVHLATQGEGTLLSYDGEATVGGRLAQVGARLVDVAVRRYADEFFGRLAEALASPSVAGDGAEAITANVPPPFTAEAADSAATPVLSPRWSLSPWVWVPALVLLTMLSLYLLSQA